MLAWLMVVVPGCSTSTPTPPPSAPEPVPEVPAPADPAPEAARAEAPPAPTEPPKPPAVELGRTVWNGLASTKNQCEHFDYYPNGGLRIFACHVATHLDYRRLVEAYGGFPFVRGPHTAEALDLKNPGDFGRYNPDFVVWLGRSFLPGAEDTAFRERTQPLYDANVRPLARTMEVVYRKLDAQAECARMEQRAYASAINEAHNFGRPDATATYVERWYGFLADEYCDKATPSDVHLAFGAIPTTYDGNVVKTTVGFWLRRRMDGTSGVWHEQLLKLLRAYDAAWLTASTRPATPPVPVERDD